MEAMPIVNANQENVATSVINQSENATQNTQQNDSETHENAQAYSSKEYAMVQFENESQSTNLNDSALSTDDETLVLRPDSLPTVESESNQSLSQLQWECKELSPYLQYLVHGTLPKDDNKARKLVFESENYIVVDDILYHYTSVRSRGVPKPMHLIRQLASPSQLREDVLLCYHDGPGGSHLGLIKHTHPLTRNTTGATCTEILKITLNRAMHVKKQVVLTTSEKLHWFPSQLKLHFQDYTWTFLVLYHRLRIRTHVH